MSQRGAGLPINTTESNSESVEVVGLPVAKPTLGVRTRPTIGVPGAWHSQQSHSSQSANTALRFALTGCSVGLSNLKLPPLSGIEDPAMRGNLRFPSAQDSSALSGYARLPGRASLSLFTRRRMSTRLYRLRRPYPDTDIGLATRRTWTGRKEGTNSYRRTVTTRRIPVVLRMPGWHTSEPDRRP